MDMPGIQTEVFHGQERVVQTITITFFTRRNETNKQQKQKNRDEVCNIIVSGLTFYN